MNIRTISILGCGWYGSALAQTLQTMGYEVKVSSRDAQKLQHFRGLGYKAYHLDFEGLDRVDLDFFKCDLLIISIPPRRNAEGSFIYMKDIQHIGAIAAAMGVAQQMLISSTGVYGDLNRACDENDAPEPDSLSGMAVLEAETAFLNMQSGKKTVLRFGGLVGPGRHIWKHFAGKSHIPNGLAPINLIHLKDCIGLSMAIIEQRKFGHVYNGVAPSHPTRKAFYTLANVLDFGAPCGFQDQRGPWKEVNSALVPSLLAYSYQVPDWMAWLERAKTGGFES